MWLRIVLGLALAGRAAPRFAYDANQLGDEYIEEMRTLREEVGGAVGMLMAT